MTKDCNTCIHKEGSCYPSTTIFDKDKTCKSYIPDYEGYIAELEKKNAELKKACDETQELLDKQIEATFKLDKENAELKKELKKWKDAIYADVENYDKQFTKAKEIIRAILNDVNDKNGCRLTMGIYIKAEQFLKEVEK